jgi:hypothetical protein
MIEIDDLEPPPDDSVVGTPARRPDSVRRTANINMVWPGGLGTPMQLRGRARDLLTRADGSPVVLDEATMVVDVAMMRTIEAISVTPERPGIERLVGAQGGSNLRTAIDEAVPGEREQGTPLHFILDDIAGASLIAGFAWSQGRKPGDPVPEGAPQPGLGAGGRPAMTQNPFGNAPGAARPDLGPEAPPPQVPQNEVGVRKGRIICSGLRPNGFMQQKREQGEFAVHFLRTAGDLSSDDPWAWHEIEPAPDVCMRRRRRIDAWREGDTIAVDVHFRDSLWNVEHVELALHEYTVQAKVDLATGTLHDIDAVPRVLPFPECPWAAPHAQMLVGHDVGGFRTDVQRTLTELQCCTHLNDMLRGLTEVPRFASEVLL